ELTKDLDESKFSIVINHQPTDYDNEAKAGVDLVLSGHTHGGQMVPIGLISDLFKMNDRVYGHEKRAATNFIVTSGISDWAIGFKTGCYSEFVVIDVHGK
ncbi:MAG: serine/threonine protein phosphatase, partial [Clostridiales bacterium]|nr:serine/threonine protein phosphatase [Clostridiales bacterium]